ELVNATAAGFVADACARGNAHLVHVSTDYVFDGNKPTPYREDDAPNPMSVYGRSKLAGERAVDTTRATITRTSWVCGRYGGKMVKTILRLLAERDALAFVHDQHGKPSIVADLVP